MFPFTYKPQRSIEVNQRTTAFLEANEGISDKIHDLTWIYHSISNIIPQTTENFWSGHSFPYRESWDEMQVSFTLMSFGLYKQAMSSLRGALELGLLSVYYNINDDGHLTVQKWLHSEDTKEADTPRIMEVWNILSTHPNVIKFQNQIDLKRRLLDLRYLHNYIHTKGHKYSNEVGLFKSNWQTFEEKGLKIWLTALEEVVIVVTTLHILKYPTALIKYDYSRKFGIDIPSFSHLQQVEIEALEKFLPDEYIELLNQISESDPETKDFMEWVESFPDMTEEDVENQIVDMARSDIERQGIKDYKRQQLVLYGSGSFKELPEMVKARIIKLEKWAKENNFIEPKWEINKAGSER